MFIDLIKTLDEKIDGIPDNIAKTDIKAYNDTMESICFLQMNIFPGLFYTESDNKLLKKWLEYNKNILLELIKFYSPNILVGSGKHSHNDKNLNIDIQNIIKTFNSQEDGYKVNYGKFYYDLIRYGSFIFIAAYHPLFRNRQVLYELMKESGHLIQENHLFV